MHTIRRLSGAWASSQTLSDPEPTPTKHQHRHRHRHHCHQKNYEVLPLGGNRPIASATTAVDRMTVSSDRELRRERKRRSKSRERGSTTTKSRESTTSLGSEKSARSSRSHKSSSSSRKSREVTGESSDTKKGMMHGSSASQKEDAGGVQIVAPAMESPGSISSISSSSASSPTRSSMGIVISGGRTRRGTNDSEASIPIITATPPTPSPLEQARHRNTHPLAPRTLASPPYPATPPVSSPKMQSRTGDYIAYHQPAQPRPTSPLGIHPALRTGSPRPRAYTTPSTTSSPPIRPVEIGSSDSIPHRRTSKNEDPYLLLQRFDTILIIDDSASMTAHWSATRAALETVATVAVKHDNDGIDIHFMNHPEHSALNVKSAVHIRRLFSQVEPAGCTPTGQCLDEILREYIDRYAASKAPVSPSSSPSSQPKRVPVKPLNILVLTDGEPTDDPESVIVSAARKLEMLNAPLHQVGIQFLQIGDEEGAREALEELDDALEEVYGIRDMVDTTRYVKDGEEISGALLLKAMVGGVNRRLDRRPL